MSSPQQPQASSKDSDTADAGSTPAAGAVDTPPADNEMPSSLESPAAVEAVDETPAVVHMETLPQPKDTPTDADSTHDPETPVLGTLPTKNEKFIDTIQQLVEQSNKQSDRMNTALERLNLVVESLKSQPQSSDKKTAFWTAYKTLADEFDKEFQRKYGDDLDTSLIFVCTLVWEP
ncbi:hypothetical protein DFH09DRAFT_508589 [Mycena vulgaris]|nr:hypothetical protein DFH09DRAFT_508589 [Mycena vulgaris]